MYSSEGDKKRAGHLVMFRPEKSLSGERSIKRLARYLGWTAAGTLAMA